MRSTTAMMLAPGWRWTFTMTAGWRSIHAACCEFSAASTMVATSEARTGGAVAIGDDDRLVVGAREQLVVGVDGVRLARAVERALGLVDVGGGESGAQVFKAEVVSGELRGIGLDAHGGLLAAGDGDQADAGDLRNLLREVGVGGVLDLVQRQRVGGERQRHDRRVGGVHLAVDGRVGQVGGQEAVGRVDGRLHFLLGHVDVLRRG